MAETPNLNGLKPAPHPKHIRIDRNVLDGDDAFHPIEPVWWTANIYDGEQKYERRLAGFSRPQRLVFAIHWYRAEVNNGGHHQFYSNSTGVVWRDALAGFEEMGLPDYVAVSRDSAQLLGGTHPSTGTSGTKSSTGLVPSSMTGSTPSTPATMPSSASRTSTRPCWSTCESTRRTSSSTGPSWPGSDGAVWAGPTPAFRLAEHRASCCVGSGTARPATMTRAPLG